MHRVGSAVIVTAPKKALALEGVHDDVALCAVAGIESVRAGAQVECTGPAMVRPVVTPGDGPDVEAATEVARTDLVHLGLSEVALLPNLLDDQRERRDDLVVHQQPMP